LELLPLSGYWLSYSYRGWMNAFKIFSQLPKILTAIKRENRWLDTIVKKNKIDIVISDCRFGLYHKDVFCVIMTHQLQIKSPLNWTERWLRKSNYHFINQFNECWVPDQQDAPNIAGEISHPAVLPAIPVKYIGGLSRFNKNVESTLQTIHDILIILSGPEPQRTVLEKIIVQQLAAIDIKSLRIAMVRGLPKEKNTLQLPGITVFNHLTADDLNEHMQNSKLVISRSGYTTVMDILKLQKQSLLIPTPSQPEQEYLGKYLMQMQWCACMPQRNFSLQKGLDMVAAFDFKIPRLDMELYKTAVMQTIHAATAKSSPIFAPNF